MASHENAVQASCGWFKTIRSNEALELIRINPNAFMLTYIIAYRARYTEGFNADGLALGEAMLGDYNNYGMTEQQYRTAKQQLEKWNFATFKTTTRGSIGKLMDTRLFDPLNISCNVQINGQPTDSQRTNNGQATTNKKDKKDKKGKKCVNGPPFCEQDAWASVELSPDRFWQSLSYSELLFYKGQVEDNIRSEREHTAPDEELIAFYMQHLEFAKSKMKEFLPHNQGKT